MNILLHIAFNGGAYHGFQVQQNALSVCTVLQNSMERLFGARPDVKGCSRTDAGVHARQFCLSFRQQTGIPMAKLPLALNTYLPADIRVLRARLVPEDFHARYSVLGKEYEYVILNSHIDDPFRAGQYHRVAHPLNAALMQEAAGLLVGRHDFAAFQSAGSDVLDTVRTIQHFTVHREGEWMYLRVAADGFLYNMVRILAGTLVAVGSGKLQPQAIPGILAARSRQAAGDTLPPRGLFLNRVFYPEAALHIPGEDALIN